MTKTKDVTVESHLEGTFEVVMGMDRYSNKEFAPMLNDREQLGLVGRLAVRLVEQYGVIAGMPAGEDAAGRQKGDLMPVDQVVDRAVGIAEATVDKLRERGHTILLPSAIPFFTPPSDDEAA